MTASTVVGHDVTNFEESVGSMLIEEIRAESKLDSTFVSPGSVVVMNEVVVLPFAELESPLAMPTGGDRIGHERTKIIGCISDGVAEALVSQVKRSAQPQSPSFSGEHAQRLRPAV